MSAEPAARARPWELSILAALLATAALLRFTHLDAGLRHTPHMDERYFVDNATHMLATGSLDPGWYEYPGLMFDLLLPVLAVVHASEPPAPSAYLAGRALIATCGVLAVGLAWVFGRRLAGPYAALCAAALLTVSPVHVQTAHTLRPDVVLECFALVAFLSFLKLDGSLRRDVLAGVALGLAVGLKFSGGLLVVPFVVARLRAPARVRGVALAGVVALLVFAVVSPYALLKAGSFGEGLSTQLTYHYQEQPVAPEPYAHKLLAYALVWEKALGWPSLVLAVAGLAWLGGSAWRKRVPPGSQGASTWLPFLLLPPLTAAVMASTGYFFNRHLLPSMSVIALLAGLALQWLLTRSRLVGLAALGLCLVFPAWETSQYLAAIGRPSTRDRAADWLGAHIAAPARVLTNVPGLRTDPTRFELLRPSRLDRDTISLLTNEAGASVWLDDQESVTSSLPLGEGKGVRAGASAGANEALEPQSPFEGPRLLLTLHAIAPSYRDLPLTSATLSASDSPAELEALRDGRMDTFWAVDAERGRRHWIEVAFPAPIHLARVELLLGDRPEDAGRGLGLEVATGAEGWRSQACVSARPPTREQVEALGGFSEVLACPEVETRAVRIVRQAGARRWSVAELHLQERAR